MTRREQTFLAMMALGFFSVDGEGRVWRHRRLAGSRTGGPSTSIVLRDPVRAERSVANYPKILFRSHLGRKAVYAHRIVWMVSNHRDIPDRMEINHKDGNKFNNEPDNLELVTHAENTLHSFRELGQKSRPLRGSKNTSAKLDEAKVLEIRSLCAEKRLPQSVVAAMYGVSQRTISEIHLHKTWKHVP